MKDKDFQQLVDHELSQLAWSDQQRMDTLRQMQKKEERPVMKRKLSMVIIAVALLLALTGTAVAAGLTIPTLQEFFNLRTKKAYWYNAANDTYSFYDAPIVDETATARPLAQRHTSQRVNITVDQLYLTDEAFYFTVLFTPKQENALLFDGGHNSIMLDGKEQYYWNLWDRKEFSLYTIGHMSIDDLVGRNLPIELDYSESQRDPEAGAIAAMLVMSLNPISSYVGYQINITGDSGIFRSFCAGFGLDINSRLFSYTFYKLSAVMLLLSGLVMICLAIRRMKKTCMQQGGKYI